MSDRIEGLRTVTGNFSGYFDDAETIMPDRRPHAEVPISYLTVQRRRRWRWEIVEYTGRVAPESTQQQREGDEIVMTATFQTTGPLQRTVWPRRFWFRWAAYRHIRRSRP